MKKIIFAAMILVGTLMIFNACHSHDHPHNPDGSHPTDNGHGHAHNPDGSHVNAGGHAHNADGSHPAGSEPLSYTLWTDKCELFVEFKPLVVGQESSFAAHFSDMSTFKAIKAGSVILKLMKNGQIIEENVVPTPSSPGIFRPVLTPKQAGNYTLQFVLSNRNLKDTIHISKIKVYADEDAAIAANPPAPEGDEVSFLKEQAWKIDFGIAQAKRQDIHEVIHTSGEFLPIKSESKIIVAKRSGLVFYKNKKLQEGREVRVGEVLFHVNSKGLLQNNLEEKYQTAKARLDKSKADLERAKKLQQQEIIGQKEYEKRKMELAIAEAEFNNLNTNYQAKGQSITAPITGIIKNILVTDGQFVEEGSPLVEISSHRQLILQAEVAQSELPKLHAIQTANFKTPYRKEVQSIEDYNGRLISYGKVLEAGSNFIPVLFELDNLKELIPGSFAELFLKTKSIKNQLVVPKSALMQDYNSIYVYVQTGGESFEKRAVKLGIDDGVNVQILSGIEAGEWVVTKGAYQVKMASMSSAIPAHGHEH